MINNVAIQNSMYFEVWVLPFLCKNFYSPGTSGYLLLLLSPPDNGAHQLCLSFRTELPNKTVWRPFDVCSGITDV